MDKLLTHILLSLFIKDKRRTKMVVDVLFGDNIPKTVNKPKVVKTINPKVINTVKVIKNEEVIKPKPINNKRDEIIDAINYLKSKKRKTKEDKDKIQMLEVILKSSRINIMRDYNYSLILPFISFTTDFIHNYILPL